MIVCICQNISDQTINQDIDDGLNYEEIIEKNCCTLCRCCNPYIELLVTEYSNM